MNATHLKVLIVALDGVIPDEVPDGEVLVVAPALNSRLRHWLSDDGAARRLAEERVAAFVDRRARDRFVLPTFRAGESLPHAA